MDGYKFYCSHCGWNHEIVRGELSSTIKVSLFLMALGVIFAAVMRVRNPNEAGGWASDSASVFGVAPVLRTLRVTPSTQAEKFVVSTR